jgi:lipoprotein-releasing system permease protein
MEHGAKLRAVQLKGVDPQQRKPASAPLPKYVQNNAWQNFKSR